MFGDERQGHCFARQDNNAPIALVQTVYTKRRICYNIWHAPNPNAPICSESFATPSEGQAESARLEKKVGFGYKASGCLPVQGNT
jgi:hypothetical protein